MSNNPAQSLLPLERYANIPAEGSVGGYFEGESQRDQRAGKDRLITCTIYKRAAVLNSYFMRITLRSKHPRGDVLRQGNMDVDRYAAESDLSKAAAILAVNLAIEDMERIPTAVWDLNEVSMQGAEALREFLRELNG